MRGEAEGDTQVPDRQAEGTDRIPSASLGSRHYRRRRHYRDRRGELNYTWGVTALLMCHVSNPVGMNM